MPEGLVTPGNIFQQPAPNSQKPAAARQQHQQAKQL